MKKSGVLNSDIASVMAYMGHTDTLCIGDCGLPVPDTTERIDLALCFGVPTFLQTLQTVAGDMKIEKIILAEEIRDKNPQLHEAILDYFKKENDTVETAYVPHTTFKELTGDCKAVIRTGENTPYANIILQSACIF